MLKQSNVYYYCGLFLDDKMLNEMEIKKGKGLDIIFILQNYDSVYTLDKNKTKVVNKQSLMEILGKENNKDKEYFYRVNDNNFILIPVQKYYGISSFDNNLIAYYDDQTIRDTKLTLVNNGDIQALTEDIDSGRKEIMEFNHQYELRKIYTNLSNVGK